MTSCLKEWRLYLTCIVLIKCQTGPKCIHIKKSNPKKEKVLCWKPRQSGVLKLSVDDDLFTKIQKAVVDVILRDEVG